MNTLTGLLRPAARLLRCSQADRWSFLFSQVAVYSFVMALVSGVFLVVFFKPSMTGIIYHGSYHQLNGIRMSEAYKSTLDISFDVRGGLLMRQIHHWAALIFVAAVCLQLLRLFSTGAFRRPRWLNWLIWVTLLLLGMAVAWTGTILPDDLMSSGSLELLQGVLKSVSLVGGHLALWVFGGAIPGHQVSRRRRRSCPGSAPPPAGPGRGPIRERVAAGPAAAPGARRLGGLGSCPVGRRAPGPARRGDRAASTS
ncbi:MAG: cytochrome b N-terminal domain-containing protein [Streptosporangiaceae bacterium]